MEHDFMNHMSREAINLLGVGSTGLREDISLNQKLYYPTSTSTSKSSTPNWVLKLVNDSIKEESFATPRYCPMTPMPCTMFRAPSNMRRADDHAYDPVLVSIGPFHYKKKLLQEMEEHKLRFLFCSMRYQGKEERELRLLRLAEAMKRLEGRARECYSEVFEHISTDDFVRMMVIDGCFIIELFRNCLRTEKEMERNLMNHMSREAINNSDSLLLVVGSTGLREDISLNQKLDYPTIASTSSTPNWVLKLVNEYSMKEESFATPRYCPMPCTMFRAPTNMKRVDEHAYDPVLVSIGPFHYKNPLLQEMEEHKLRFLFGSMRYESKEEREHWLQRLAEAMKRLEGRARWCYSEAFEHISTDDFVRMMVIDGCFIIELFRYYLRSEKEILDDPIFRTRWKLPVIRLDLVKLENQLPFFVLQELYLLTSLGHEPPLIYVALKFLDPLLTRAQKTPIQDHFLEQAPDHLLALFHSTFKPIYHHPLPSSYGSLMQEKKCLIPSVRELQRVGIFLKSGEGDLLDIKYQSHHMTVLTGRASLEIPPLFIDYKTGPILRNLVAYEQCNRSVKPYFTSYIMFFDGLVNTPEDVQILRNKKIFYHVLGSDHEVSVLLNDLTKNVAYDHWHECYLSPLIETIYLRSNKTYLKIMAALRREYFSSPVNSISYLITVLLLYLSVIQTMFTIIAYIRPHP